ncbi:hypothetical protein BDB00DRAFT_845217 [Zychaea mexicana]|uniref:uncharacterized protein n=1 Tax=Zychaea mexicana TaxID=64656 RepID=UPI0022FEECFB|nr:uncharacterized protein BDB00DRAFT_845217 [Zychaea mexicana]KAI9489114.1 hypothetical protein BDB00DRAFT_845217 [Zychaea mexicana]
MASYYNNQHDYGAPPPPQHYQDSSYPMYDMGYRDNNVTSPTVATDDGYGAKRSRNSRQNGQYQHLGDGGPVLYVEQQPEKRSCLDKMCCGCCTCFPRWARWICCFLFLIIVAIGIVIGVLAALFKTPEINFNGLQGEPSFNLTGTTANFNFNLNITVDNPNVLGVTFEKIEAKAYYPGYRDKSIGGGIKDNVHIGKETVTTIIFPFTISVDAMNTETQAILYDIMGKCGVLGGEAPGITIDYDVVPTLDIIGIKISPTISNSANLPCDNSVSYCTLMEERRERLKD